LRIIGAAVVLCAVVVTAIFVFNPFGGKASDRLSVAIETPYVVQGIYPGTALVMQGVEVGRVTAVSSLRTGGVRVDAAFQKSLANGLTDAMQIDFRPANYFGVTGVNITPVTGGRLLHDGMHINKVPKGNFTLQALLSRLGELSSGVITPQLVSVIDRATRYTDGLDPLIETMLIATNAVAQVQTVPTARLLANTTGLSVAFPGFLNAFADAGDHISHADSNWMHKGLGDNTEETWQNTFIPTIEAIANGIFKSVGQLEKSHVSDLLPLVNGVQGITDTVPALLRPIGVGDTLVELRKRFENLYKGPPEQRALQVRIALDSLPAMASALGVLGAPR
jgi:hypothetical protein